MGYCDRFHIRIFCPIQGWVVFRTTEWIRMSYNCCSLDYFDVHATCVECEAKVSGYWQASCFPLEKLLRDHKIYTQTVAQLLQTRNRQERDNITRQHERHYERRRQIHYNKKGRMTGDGEWCVLEDPELWELDAFECHLEDISKWLDLALRTLRDKAPLGRKDYRRLRNAIVSSTRLYSCLTNIILDYHINPKQVQIIFERVHSGQICGVKTRMPETAFFAAVVSYPQTNKK